MVDIFIIMKMSTMTPSGLSVMARTVYHRFRAGGSSRHTRCWRIVLTCGDEALRLTLAVAPVPSFPRSTVNRNPGKGWQPPCGNQWPSPTCPRGGITLNWQAYNESSRGTKFNLSATGFLWGWKIENSPQGIRKQIFCVSPPQKTR